MFNVSGNRSNDNFVVSSSDFTMTVSLTNLLAMSAIFSTNVRKYSDLKNKPIDRQILIARFLYFLDVTAFFARATMPIKQMASSSTVSTNDSFGSDCVGGSCSDVEFAVARCPSSTLADSDGIAISSAERIIGF